MCNKNKNALKTSGMHLLNTIHMTTTGKIATGFILGTVVGATFGLLFAPKKGSQTRAMIADKAKDVRAAVSDTYVKAKELLGADRTPHEKESVLG